MQRICRYPLLLKELLKLTEDSHPDHAEIEKALARLEAVVKARALSSA